MNKLNIKMNNFDIKEWRYKQALQELSDKQKQIAQAAPPTDKITGADFKALKNIKEDDWKQTDDESDMAKSQLSSIHSNAVKLLDMIESNEQLDAWVQSKLTKAQDYLQSVYDYMQSENTEKKDNVIYGEDEY
jgi:cellobiose-specific phosphotransferase system component IIA